MNELVNNLKRIEAWGGPLKAIQYLHDVVEVKYFDYLVENCNKIEADQFMVIIKVIDFAVNTNEDYCI